MMRARPSQAIRIFRGLLLAALTNAGACAGDDIAWTDPLTLSTASDDARLAVDEKGRVRLVGDTSVSVVPADAAACAASIRDSRLDDGTLAVVWWSARLDSSAVLLTASSPDGGKSWHRIIPVDTTDVSTTACNRPAPAIAASAGLVHIAYSMRASEGVGVFYAHSMNAGKSYEAPVTILYGDRLTRVAIASEKGTVAVAYEEPSGATPQIGLAISRDWGHIFRERTRGSTGVGAATDPQVAVVGREIAISWLVGAATGGAGSANFDARTRIVRVGRLQ